MAVSVQALPQCPECHASLVLLERFITGIRLRGYQCTNEECDTLYFDEQQIVRLQAVIRRRVQEGLPSGFEETPAE